MPTQQSKGPIRPAKPFVSVSKFKKLEDQIKINFKNQGLLKNAFVHRSYLNEHKTFRGPSNERLEFLGDSVLSIIVSRFLYLQLPASPEGELTQLRASLVRTETLAKIAEKLSLGEYLFLSKGEEDSGGRQNNSILANTFEALVGAIYLDKGYDAAEKFIDMTILKNWRELSKSAVSDNKSRLQEILQRNWRVSPVYKLLSSWGPDHARQFKIGVYMDDKLLGSGVGKNKQQAAQNAAEDALSRLPARKK